MATVGLRGLYFWFAGGIWASAILLGVVEQLVQSMPQPPHDLPTAITIFLMIPLGLLIGLVFLAWFLLRSRKNALSRMVVWFVPFTLGASYLPLSSALLWLFIKLTGQGQGTWIGMFAYAI